MKTQEYYFAHEVSANKPQVYYSCMLLIVPVLLKKNSTHILQFLIFQKAKLQNFSTREHLGYVITDV